MNSCVIWPSDSNVICSSLKRGGNVSKGAASSTATGIMKGTAGSDTHLAIERIMPFATEKALSARLGVARQYRQEQRAALNIVADFEIETVTGVYPVEIEPNCEGGGLERTL